MCFLFVGGRTNGKLNLTARAEFDVILLGGDKDARILAGNLTV
jgi:hypothetical protein